MTTNYSNNLYRCTATRLLAAVLLLASSITLHARPTAVEYSRELDSLTQALQTIHPAPWRNQIQQKFKAGLTSDPDLLNKYPLGPWLSISKALKLLDNKQNDAVTSIHLFKQQQAWHLMPVSFGVFEEGIYVIAADEPFLEYVGQRLQSINGRSPSQLLQRLANYLPDFQTDWLPQYLRMAEMLDYLGAPCRTTCMLEFDTSKISLKKEQMIQNRDFQAQLQPVHLVRSFWQQNMLEQRVSQLTQTSLYWNLSGKALQASQQFNESLQLAEGYLRSQAITNVILDFRALDAVTSNLVNRLQDEIRRMPQTNPHRVIYAVVDRSTGLLVADLLSRMQQMPEVVFVGQPLGISLSHYYDPKTVKLTETGLEVSIASRYQKFMNEEATVPFRVSHRVEWSASDYFRGSDTVLNTILDLIEINQPD